MNAYDVSIIIPTCRGSENIELAVVSALEQRNVSIEVIVVDDNGKETKEQRETQLRLKKYIDENKIKYIIHDQNRNGSVARNTGLKASKGKYVCFLDDDDYMYPDKARKQMNALIKHKDCKMCICSGYYVGLDGRGYKKIMHQKENILYKYLRDRMYFNTSAIMFERQNVLAIGGFDESFRRHQDWEIVTRFLSKYNAITVKDCEMIRYLQGRNHPRNIEQRIEDLEYFFKMCTIYMNDVLTKRQVEKVRRFRKREICCSILINCGFMKAFKYARSYGGIIELIAAVNKLGIIVARKILCGSRKVAPSRIDLEKEFIG